MNWFDYWWKCCQPEAAFDWTKIMPQQAPARHRRIT